MKSQWLKPEWVEEVLLADTISEDLKRAAFMQTMKDPFSRQIVVGMSSDIDTYSILLSLRLELTAAEAKKFYKEAVDKL